MKRITEQLYTVIPYTPAGTYSQFIGAKSYWITGMALDYILDLSTGAGSALNQDMMFRTIASISLQGGGRPYMKISTPDARILYWGTRMRLQGRSKVSDFGNVQNQTTQHMVWAHSLPIIFGVQPVLSNDQLNWWDPTAAVAPDTDLSLQVGFREAGSLTVNSSWGTQFLVNTATSFIRVTLYGIVPEKADEEPRYYPSWQTSQWAPGQTYNGLSGTINLSPGYWYRRSHLMSLLGSTSATPNVDFRTDGIGAYVGGVGNAISEAGVKTADGRLPVNNKVITLSQQSQSQIAVGDDNTALSQAGGQGASATQALGASAVKATWNPGVWSYDWPQLADTSNPAEASPMYGLNLNSKNLGVVQLAFTVDAGTNTSIVQLHETYLAY